MNGERVSNKVKMSPRKVEKENQLSSQRFNSSLSSPYLAECQTHDSFLLANRSPAVKRIQTDKLASEMYSNIYFPLHPSDSNYLTSSASEPNAGIDDDVRTWSDTISGSCPSSPISLLRRHRALFELERASSDPVSSSLNSCFLSPKQSKQQRFRKSILVTTPYPSQITYKDKKLISNKQLDSYSKPTTGFCDMVLGIFRDEHTLPANHFFIDDSSGLLEVVDCHKTLGLHDLPTYKDYLYKITERLSSHFPIRRKRYAVLENCTFSWYKSKSAYDLYGLRAAQGSFNFILQSCKIDYGKNTDSFFIIVNSCNKIFRFNVSGSDVSSKGKWMTYFLLHINKGQSIRARFPDISWTLLEFEILHRLQPIFYKCLCSVCSQYIRKTASISEPCPSQNNWTAQNEFLDCPQPPQRQKSFQSVSKSACFFPSNTTFLFRRWWNCAILRNNSSSRFQREECTPSPYYWDMRVIPESLKELHYGNFDMGIQCNKFWRNAYRKR